MIAATSPGGVVDAINTYDAYGIPGDNNQGRFAYTGQLYLPSLGLYYYKARIYNPELGRFMQTDPIGYEDQMNLYAYVGNDPVNMVDPIGLWRTPNYFMGVNVKQAQSMGISAQYKNQVQLGNMERKKRTFRSGLDNFSLAMTVPAALGCEPCSAFALGADSLVSYSYYLDEEFLKAGLSMVPGPTGELAGTSLKIGKKVTAKQGDILGSATSVMVDEIIDMGFDAFADGFTDTTSSRGFQSRADKGMSGGKVHICSGMGAQKEC